MLTCQNIGDPKLARVFINYTPKWKKHSIGIQYGIHIFLGIECFISKVKLWIYRVIGFLKIGITVNYFIPM